MKRQTRVACLSVLASVLLGQTGPVKNAPEVQTRESQATITPAAAIERLQEGNRRFVANAMKQRDWSAKVVATASGQFPFAAVLGAWTHGRRSRSLSTRASATCSVCESPATSSTRTSWGASNMPSAWARS